MKQFKFFMFFMGLFALALVSSCNKDERPESSISNQTSSVRTLIEPSSENGTLKFETKEDAKNYLDQIDLNMAEEDEGISFVNNLEATKTYQSLFTENINNPNNRLFNDNSFNAIMNRNYEVIMGNSIFIQKHPDEIYEIDKGDIANRDLIRTLAPNQKLDLTQLNPGIRVTGDDEVFYKTTDYYCGCTIKVIKDRTRPYIISLVINCAGQVLDPNANLEVQWGDGSFSTAKMTKNTPVLSSNFPITLTKNYGAESGGIRNITVTIPMNCGTGTKNEVFNYSFDINETSCCDGAANGSGNKRVGEYEMYWEYDYRNTAWGKRSKMTIKGYKWTGNNKDKFKADLEVDVNNDVRNNSCLIYNESNDEGCTNCYEVTDRRYFNNKKNINGDLRLNYNFLKHGSSIMHFVTPTICQ